MMIFDAEAAADIGADDPSCVWRHLDESRHDQPVDMRVRLVTGR
jgi:hypothetical protein